MDWLLSIFKSVGRYLAAATESRDVVIRRRGAVKYLTISRWIQIPAFIGLVGFLGWFAHISYVYHGYDEIIKSKNEDLARAISHNRSLTGKVSDMQSDITDVAGTLKKSHHNLVNLITQNDNFNSALKKLKGDLQVSERKRGEQLRRQAALNAQLKGLERQLDKAEKYAGRLNLKVDEAKSELTTALVDRGAFASARDWLQKRVDRLELRIKFMRKSQKSALAAVSERTLYDIRKISGIIESVGLSPEKLLQAYKPELYSAGGPYIPAGKGNPVLEDDDAILEQHLTHWEDLNKLMRSVPLVAPIDHYNLSSKFGRRRDPMNKKWAQHQGLDLASRPRSTIFAPADGKIIYAGWKGRYGRVIEIDHGFGIVTRYGHLRRTSVKRGKRVKIGDKIGELGSSGRSTGPHVHYEIRVNKKAVDPLKFIKAGKDVFKG
ncbi:MAG: peptidoglycan DD-metalloendopeptidase family protein [Alphaproteobacteria bacterium]|nr:peptidoglycan DD-metalloendopeptidase family protein [Alphaproteobacteria bacterium]